MGIDKVKMSDNELDAVVGGASQNYLVAMDVVSGKYGDGDARRRNLEAAGYNYDAIQRITNGLIKGYDKVALDVIRGNYGSGQACINALRSMGYDAALVQDMVNEIMA